MRITQTLCKFFINVSFKFTPGAKLLPTLVNSVDSRVSIEKKFREINFRELNFWKNSRDKLSRKGLKFAKVSPIKVCISWKFHGHTHALDSLLWLYYVHCQLLLNFLFTTFRLVLMNSFSNVRTTPFFSTPTYCFFIKNSIKNWKSGNVC